MDSEETRGYRAFLKQSVWCLTSQYQVSFFSFVFSVLCFLHGHFSFFQIGWAAGIMFQDITTLLLDHKAFKDTVDIFVDRYRDMGISVVAGTL